MSLTFLASMLGGIMFLMFTIGVIVFLIYYKNQKE